MRMPVALAAPVPVIVAVGVAVLMFMPMFAGVVMDAPGRVLMVVVGRMVMRVPVLAFLHMHSWLITFAAAQAAP